MLRLSRPFVTIDALSFLSVPGIAVRARLVISFLVRVIVVSCMLCCEQIDVKDIRYVINYE
jgi:hypothetical protein